MRLDNVPETVSDELLIAARQFVDRPATGTRCLWPRAAALLARQALEVAVKTYWAKVAPGVAEAPMRAQLLCLEAAFPSSVVGEAHHVWTALSRATHHHVYELPPTSEELTAWCDIVARLVEQLDEACRRRAS